MTELWRRIHGNCEKWDLSQCHMGGPNIDHSFPRYGRITFLTFRRPTTLTFDLKFWKYLSVTVYPYVICMPSFIMIGWEMAEILYFEILRKHGQTNKHTNKHTNRHVNYNTSPSPYGGRGNERVDLNQDRPSLILEVHPAPPPPPQIAKEVNVLHMEKQYYSSFTYVSSEMRWQFRIKYLSYLIIYGT